MKADLVSSVLPFASASDELLAAILDQSPDCIKVLSADGRLEFMNRAGQCALEIDDFGTVAGQAWSALWPAESRHLIEEALSRAGLGRPAQFSAFCPTAKGSPRWWDVSVRPLQLPDGFAGFVAISRDITARVEAQEMSEAIAAEMRHRLRNAYQVASGLMTILARGEPEREAFARDMGQRLVALGAAQTLDAKAEDASLTAAIRALVLPYATPDCPIKVAELPAHVPDRRQMEALGMVFGELAVNSTKHGALSASGTVRVESAEPQAETVGILWSERSDRPVARHHRSGGNGMVLMNRILASTGGEIELSWHADGLDALVKLGRSRSG